MLIHRKFHLLMIAAILMLTACSPQVAAVSPTPTQAPSAVPTPAPAMPAAASSPTVTASSTAVPSPTASPNPTPTAAATEVPTVQTYTVKPDDKTQARLRVMNCVFNSQDNDIYINGQKVDNGGVPYWSRGHDASGYLYLAPGKVNLAVTPGTLDQPLLALIDINLAAGHRYTVVIMGQPEDTKHSGLVIDETKVIQDAGAGPNRYTGIYVNNLKGPKAIDHFANGKAIASAVPYGGYKAEVVPAGIITSDVDSVTGAPDQIIDGNNSPAAPPATPAPLDASRDSVGCWSGKYPGGLDQDYTWVQTTESTPLSLLDYLKQYTDLNKALHDQSYSFNDFLTLVNVAGMADILNNSPHLVFVPTDKAFFLYVPKDRLDVLLKDPKAAEAFLKANIIDGYYPYGSLPTYTHNALGGPNPERTLTTMSGASLKLTVAGEELKINGQSFSDEWPSSLFTANGSRIWFVAHFVQAP
jgi:uncharacterized surface protein with fasciclin (FAS1) repeats